MRRLAIVASLLALTAGCAGPPVALAPVEPVVAPAEWRTDTGPTAPLDRAWWQAFGDPQLTALVEAALARNIDIAQAAARIRDARAQERLAHAQLLPTVDAAASASDSRSIDAFGVAEVQQLAQPGVQAAWEADIFGRLADQQAAARAGWLASQAARDSIRLSVAATAANGYIALLGLDAQLAIAQQTLDARRRELQLAERRVGAGYSPRLDLAQAQAEYQATAQLIPSLREATARQENALRLLTGDVPGAVARATSLALLTEPVIPEGLPSQLLARRPDVTQAELQLAAADKSLAAARKRFLPQLQLTGSGALVWSSLLVGDPIGVWSLGGSILAPIFEGGRLRAGAESAAAQRDNAALAYRKAALTAFREVEDALGSAREADELMTILTTQRTADAEGLRLATNRFREGYSPYLEQLVAQRGLLNVELNLVQARTAALQARVSLYLTMGGGWSRDAVAGLAAAP
ncbi:NodT family efflux transporter outer membrane factor (OMF) lipoprotein [Novosphingobium sp. PhB165]|uniref:efflux transporter outer membrane subunit n=1 Tax=Novosphingobium sp. PhB165 TaxID=2485105 RepID=UPI001044F04F|nr:efflux transporter outer membrane subunit [Novosphingobium sp. PhB165]TCM16128.1 NodT family efflux transporter outer membrane factor (OMF) lipoprotein [Novosphingobium sp. PhB165]